MRFTMLILAALTAAPIHAQAAAPRAAATAKSARAPLAQAPGAAMFRGDASHTGVYPGRGGAIIGMQWRFATDGDVTATPVVAYNTVYVGSGDGRFYAIDRNTGNPRWTFDAHSPIQSSAAVLGNLVFFATRSGTLYALDTKSGAMRWRLAMGPDLPLPWGHESGDVWIASPTISNGVLYIGGGDGVLYAVTPATGTVRWRARTGGRIRTAPAVADNTVYIGSFDGNVYAFNAATGAERWHYATLGASLDSKNFGFDRRSIQSSPAVGNGMVFVGARDGFVYALDAATGEKRWTYDHNISWINSSPAVANGVVYDGSSDGHFVQALDASSGKELWRAPSTGVVWSSPAITDNYVYFGEGSGQIHVVDRSSGKEASSFFTGALVHSSPVIDGSMLFIGSGDGGVYALRLGDAASAMHRAVFYDSTWLNNTTVANARNIHSYLGPRGYMTLDAASLLAFMTSRIADHEPSVVVFANDLVPDAVATAPLSQSIFRRYLNAGGKVVWLGMPPALWPVEPVHGERKGLDELVWNAPESLLGVSHEKAIFDQRGVRATKQGERWGLARSWRSAWGVDPAGVTDVLATDDWGYAAAWAKRYGGPQGTGFVRVPPDSPLAVYLAAEYRPAESGR